MAASPAAPAETPRTGGWFERGGAWDWLERPGVPETLLVGIAVGVFGIWWWRQWRAARHAHRRRAHGDRLEGVRLLEAEDFVGARRVLETAHQRDPDDPVVRWALGRALLELGEWTSAHKHLLVLRRAYRVLGPEAEAAWLDAMAATGQAQAALSEPTQRASAGVLRSLFGVAHAAEHWQTAAVAARRLDERSAGGAAGWAAQAVDAEWRGAQQALAAGDRDAAVAAAQRAFHDGLDGPRRGRLELQLAAAAGASPADLGQRLAAAAPAEEVFVGVSTAQPGDARCRGLAALAPPDAGPLVAPLDHPAAVLDALEQNRAWIGRLVQAARKGDGEAARDLVGLGSRAVPALVEASVRAGTDDDPAVDILCRMGPVILDALFSFHRRELQRPGVAREPLTARVGAVLRGMDRAALPVLGKLLSEADRDLRPLVLDFHLGLADPKVLASLLEQCAAVELVQRLNRAPASVLERILAADPGPASAALVELFADPAFGRDEALADSIGHELASKALVRRGWSAPVGRSLIERLAEPGRGDAAAAVLVEFGAPAAPQLVSAWADPGLGSAEAAAIEGILRRMGAGAVQALCEWIGPMPAPIDERVQALIVSMGATTAADGLARQLVDAGAPAHRRRWAVGCLAGLGTAGLGVLREIATDAIVGDVRLDVRRALERAEPAEGGGDGQVG